MKLFKKNNKGFSLVELIVVVAIMAVLMAILIPTLIRHVENTRFQKDISAIEEIRAQMENSLANENFATISGTFTDTAANPNIEVDQLQSDVANKTEYLNEVCQSLAGTGIKTYTYKLTSKLSDANTQVVFTIAHEKVTYEIKVSGTNTYNGSDKLKSANYVETATPASGD